MPDTLSATLGRRSAALPSAYAMIFFSLGRPAEFAIVLCRAGRSTPMMGNSRFNLSCRTVLFLTFLFSAPTVAHCDALDDSAKDLAGKIAAAVPAQSDISIGMQNSSSLNSDEVTRVQQVMLEELHDRGIRTRLTGFVGSNVAITLSEGFENLVWSAELHGFDTDKVILTMAPRITAKREAANVMPVSLRSEKFWEGPERVLDAGEMEGIGGGRWFVLLLRDKLVIQEPAGKLEINFEPDATRAPWGKLNIGRDRRVVAFSLQSRECTADLDMRRVVECLPQEAAPSSSRPPLVIDLAPQGPPPAGKGTELAIGSICGGPDEFLATGSGDYTQTDSVQAMQPGPKGPLPVSAELFFPGPVLLLHGAADAPRAIVRNLTTGNYEAYRLAISCAP